MNYKEKKLRENAFRSALNELLIVANKSPCLSLMNRRAVVAAIDVGENFQHKCQKEQESFSRNYQLVYQGLCNAFHEKISEQTEMTERLKHAISKISSLVAWAGSNPNRTDSIFEDFAEKMVPEDTKIHPDLSPVDAIERQLHKELGVEKSFDFITIPLELFNKKYSGR